MKRSLFISLALALFGVSVGLSGGNDLRVITEKAEIYAEPNSQSYLIETVKRGTSLSLFQKGKIRKEWYYIVFFSSKRKGRVSGFIQESMVAAASDYEDIDKATPFPSVKKEPEPIQADKAVGFPLEQELWPAAPEKIGVTPLKDIGGSRHSLILPSDTMDTAAFKHISEIPVDLEKRRGFTDLLLPEKEGKAFLEISEPPVVIRTKSVPIQDPAPDQEVVPFRIKKEPLRSQIREELSETPLLARLTKSDQGFEDVKGLGEGTDLLARAASVREDRAFLKMMKPPVELESREMPFVSQPPIQDVIVFEVKGLVPEESVSPTPLVSRPVEVEETGTSAMEEVSFREVTKLPTEVTVKTTPAPIDFPPPEIKAFQVLEQVCTEELSMTPLLEINNIRSLGNTGEGNNGNGLPLLTFSTEEAAVFRIITEPPVEISTGTTPSVNPSPEMEGTAFQKLGKAARKTVRVSIPDSQKSEPIKAVISSELKLKKPGVKKPQEEIKPRPTLVQPKRENRDFRRFTLGLGYGQSLGGVGGFLQYNTKAGISIHGGVGYYPSTYIYAPHDWVKNVVLFNGGIKYYFPLKADPIHVYLDLQYGGIGVEAAQIITGIWHYKFVFENKQKTLWGPSVLAGAELRVGHVGLNGALGFSYNLTKLDWSIQQYFFTFDLGLLLLF